MGHYPTDYETNQSQIAESLRFEPKATSSSAVLLLWVHTAEAAVMAHQRPCGLK